MPVADLLLDTHAWFWALTGSKRLSRKARRLIERKSDGCWLSPISIWELGMLAQRGRLRVRDPFTSWVATSMERFPVQQATLDFAIAERAQHLRIEGCDPADHFIAATALERDLLLMTADERLLSVAWLSTTPC